MLLFQKLEDSTESHNELLLSEISNVEKSCTWWLFAHLRWIAFFWHYHLNMNLLLFLSFHSPLAQTTSSSSRQPAYMLLTLTAPTLLHPQIIYPSPPPLLRVILFPYISFVPWVPLKAISSYAIGEFPLCAPCPKPASIPHLLIHWHLFSFLHKFRISELIIYGVFFTCFLTRNPHHCNGTFP